MVIPSAPSWVTSAHPLHLLIILLVLTHPDCRPLGTTARVWDATTSTLRHTLTDHRSVKFSSHRQYIASFSVFHAVIIFGSQISDRLKDIVSAAPQSPLPLALTSRHHHLPVYARVDDARRPLFELEEGSGWINQLNLGDIGRVCLLLVEICTIFTHTIAYSGQKQTMNQSNNICEYIYASSNFDSARNAKPY
jgi:hypothetical protein